MTVLADRHPETPPQSPSVANVARFVQQATADHPERPALLLADGRVRYTFAELTDRAAAVAAGLLSRGLQPGDRVAILVRDRAEAPVPAIAALWAGATLVVPPVNHGVRPALTLTGQTRPTAIIADPSVWVLAAAFPDLRHAPIRVCAGGPRWPGLLAVGDLTDPVAPLSPGPAPQRWVDQRHLEEILAAGPVPRRMDAAALITWTTGTTGRPHPIVRSHGVLAAQHVAIRRLRTPRPDDVDLVGLPNIALHDLACGVPVVLPPTAGTDRTGELLRATVLRSGTTTAAGFPPLFERLVQGTSVGALPLLRAIHVGGAPVRRELLERLSVIAPNAAVTVVYGATEVEPIAAIDATEMLHLLSVAPPERGLPVGSICGELELRIAPVQPRAGDAPDETFRDAPIRPEARNTRDEASRVAPAATRSSTPTHADGDRNRPCARGRILVRGARVAPEPDRSDPDGWLDTGDVGEMDADGRLWLLGRASSGTVAVEHGALDTLFPAEIEGPTVALPGVAAAGLVSTGDHGASRVFLAIQPTIMSTSADVRREVAALARERGWHLDAIVVVRRLPRDGASGKIDYRRLRALLQWPTRRRAWWAAHSSPARRNGRRLVGW